MTTHSFWDFALATEAERTDALGEFVRLIRRRVIARPREIQSLNELEKVLADQRVRIPREVAHKVWADFEREAEYASWRAVQPTVPDSGQPSASRRDRTKPK